MVACGRTLRIMVAIAASLVAGCNDGNRGESTAPADLVLTGAAIYTVDDASPWASAVSITGGRISHVGDDDSVASYVGSGTTVVDLGGRLVLPGFVDTHAHPLLSAGMGYALLLDVSLDQEAILDAVRQYAAANPDRDPIVGFGFLASQFGPTGPRKEVLDEAVRDRAVLLIDDGGHSAWVNTKTLEALGIGPQTPDPVPGVHYYQRDESGNPTGWLLESQTFYPALAALGAYDGSAVKEPSNVVYSLFSAAGVTTVFDAGVFSFEEEALELALEMDRQGVLPFRLVASHMVAHPRQAAGAVARFRELSDRYQGERLRVGMIKVHNDGTTQAFTAAYLEPYENLDSRGAVLLEPDRFQELMLEADRAGIDVHIHAIGDRAARDALDAIEVARRDDPGRGTRHTIAHLELVDDADLPRFAELDVIAQTTPAWHSDNGQGTLDALGPARFAKLFRFRELVDDGVRVTFGSDFPASGFGGASPTYQIAVGHTRLQPGAIGESVPGGAEQRLSLETLIRGYTLDAAYQLRMDDEIGSIEEGKRADLVVLGANLFELDAAELSSASVDATLLDGHVVFGALTGSD